MKKFRKTNIEDPKGMENEENISHFTYFKSYF